MAGLGIKIRIPVLHVIVRCSTTELGNIHSPHILELLQLPSSWTLKRTHPLQHFQAEIPGAGQQHQINVIWMTAQ